jgi:hypothetical protein
MRAGIGTIVWVIVGVIVASAHHYFSHADKLKPIISAILAIALWPLLLFGINLHIK